MLPGSTRTMATAQLRRNREPSQDLELVCCRQAPMWQRDCFQNFRVHLEDGVLPLLLLLLRRNKPLDSLLVTRVTGGHGVVESVAG